MTNNLSNTQIQYKLNKYLYKNGVDSTNTKYGRKLSYYSNMFKSSVQRGGGKMTYFWKNAYNGQSTLNMSEEDEKKLDDLYDECNSMGDGYSAGIVVTHKNRIIGNSGESTSPYSVMLKKNNGIVEGYIHTVKNGWVPLVIYPTISQTPSVIPTAPIVTPTATAAIVTSSVQQNSTEQRTDQALPLMKLDRKYNGNDVKWTATNKNLLINGMGLFINDADTGKKILIPDKPGPKITDHIHATLIANTRVLGEFFDEGFINELKLLVSSTPPIKLNFMDFEDKRNSVTEIGDLSNIRNQLTSIIADFIKIKSDDKFSPVHAADKTSSVNLLPNLPHGYPNTFINLNANKPMRDELHGKSVRLALETW